MNLLLKWLLMTLAIIISAYLIPGVEVLSGWSAFWLAAILGILNVLLRPFLILITLPVNILTLGLFSFVINALIVLLASSIVNGFNPGGFWRAMLFSIVLSIVSYLLNTLVRTK
ncbi:MAG: phage holin family protein [Patescibacteria group bacterium]